MALPGFLFGAGTGLTYDQLQERRRRTDLLAKRIMGAQPRNVKEGIGALLQGAAVGIDNWQTDKQLGKYNDERDKLRDQLYSSLTGGLSYGQPVFPQERTRSPQGLSTTPPDYTASAMPKVDANGNIKLTSSSPVAYGDNGLPPYATALLETIAGPESNGNYDVIYGGSRFRDYSDHPRQAIPIRSGPNVGKTSSAAGKYQFIGSTWDDQAKKLGLTDFSPASQDEAAWNLARETYHRKTGQDLDTVLQSDDPEAIANVGRVLNTTWTSLPGGIEAGTNTSRFVSAYNANLERRPTQVASLDPTAGMSGADAIDAIAPPSGQPLGGDSAPYRDPRVSAPNFGGVTEQDIQSHPFLDDEQKVAALPSQNGSAHARTPIDPDLLNQIREQVLGQTPVAAGEPQSPFGIEPQAFLPRSEPGTQLPPLPSREIATAPFMASQPNISPSPFVPSVTPPPQQQPTVQVAQNGQGYYPPRPQAPSEGPGALNPAVIEMLKNPAATEQDRAMALYLLKQYQDANDPTKALERRYKQAQIEALERKATTGEPETFYGNPVPFQRQDGSFGYGQIGSRGGFKEINIGEGNRFAPNTRTVDTGTELLTVGPGGEILAREPKNNRQAASEKAGGEVEGKTAAERQASAPGDYQAGVNALGLIEDIRKDPYKSRGTGFSSYGNMIRGTGGFDFQRKVDQAKSGAFLTAIQQLRGLGALSNAEGDAATKALNRLDTSASEEGFNAALDAYETIVRQGIAKAQQNLPNGANVPPVPPPAGAGNADPLGLR
ncbi:glycoside hydrolase family 24 protein [Rhizobium terrae]|uniref:glycoside hydrolase family 24 protein n=1 Tax=Rhizobium terrae TaxID=2171756 RepID=UPI000E3C9EF7|nr:glycoside hydrolase family 104 protein [Rhizobium terrae]